MNAVAAGAVLQQTRYATFKSKSYNHNASIEHTVSKVTTNNTSIELPEEIKALITGSDYWVQAKTNRYKKLIREGYKALLLQIARMAADKRNPANWFAKVCSKAEWERTLTYFKKLEETAQKARYVAQKLKTEATRFIYRQIWRKVNVVRWADLAAETPHTKPGQSREKHFAWLCLNEQQLSI